MVELKEKYKICVEDKIDSKFVSVGDVDPCENHFLYITTDSCNKYKLNQKDFVRQITIIDERNKVLEKYDGMTLYLMQELNISPKSILSESHGVTMFLMSLSTSNLKINRVSILIELLNVPFLSAKMISNNLANSLSQKISIPMIIENKKNVEIDLNVLRNRNIEELWISVENDTDLKSIYLNHENHSNEINPVLSKQFYPYDLYNCVNPCYVIPFDKPMKFSNENLSKLSFSFNNNYSGLIHITSFGTLVADNVGVSLKGDDKLFSIGIWVMFALFIYVFLNFIIDVFDDMSSCLFIAF